MRLATFLSFVASLLSIGCGGFVGSPPERSNGGTGEADSGVASPFVDATAVANDASVSGSDGACDPTEVISAESYDQACMKDSDCVAVGEGNVCDACLLTCTTTAINARALPQFKKDLADTPAADALPRAQCSCARSAGFAPCCRNGACRADVSCVAPTPSDSGSGPDTSTVSDAQAAADAPNLDGPTDGYVSPPLDGPLPPVPDAGNCAGALVLHLGDTIAGTTCSGVQGVSGGLCSSSSNPQVFVFVDAPDGVAIELTPSLGLSVLGLDQCDSQSTSECSFEGMGPFDPSDVRMRFFAVARADTTCGDFSLSVRAK
jgi:hypothetical protein